MFAERGFQAATVEDLCAAAGFSRGAFYSNFGSKDELFLALWDEQADRIVATVAALHAGVIDGSVTAETALDLLTSHELYDRQWFVVNAEFLLHALRTPAVAEQLAAHRVRLRAGIGDVLAAVLAAQGKRLPDGIDLEMGTRMLIAGYEGAQNQTRVEPGAPDPFRATVALLIAGCPPIEA